MFSQEELNKSKEQLAYHWIECYTNHKGTKYLSDQELDATLEIITCYMREELKKQNDSRKK